MNADNGDVKATDTAPYVFGGKTAEEWRAEAAQCRKSSADSWERSDTDGFLSQWAADTMARRFDACAEIADNGGRAEQVTLYLTDGRIASTDLRTRDV